MSEYDDSDYDEDEDYEGEGEMSKTEKKIENVEVGLNLLRAFVLNSQNQLTFNLLVQQGDDVVHVQYGNQPCYGELRPYAKTHPDMLPEHQRKVGKPGDLHDPFPDGTPLAVAVPFFNEPADTTTEQYNRIINLVLDPGLSPWREALKDFEVLKNPAGRIAGVIIKDTNVDSTVMVNMFMTLRGGTWASFYSVMTKLLDQFPDEDPYLLLAAATQVGPTWQSNGAYSINPSFQYYISPALNISNFIQGKFDEKITGGTFKDRYAYNRPDLHNVFGQNDLTWTKRVKDKLGKLEFEVKDLGPVLELFKAA